MPIIRGNHFGVTLYGGTARSGSIFDFYPVNADLRKGHHAGKDLTPAAPFEALGKFSQGL